MMYSFINCSLRATVLMLLSALLIVAGSCGNSSDQASVAGFSKDAAPVQRVIHLDEVKTVLPQAGNVELVELSCTACHSLRYIEMQPNLTKKAWEKTVDKMIKTFGAPVHDSITRNDIVNYLYAIKGKEG